jgi:hypothetical protein
VRGTPRTDLEVLAAALGLHPERSYDDIVREYLADQGR